MAERYTRRRIGDRSDGRRLRTLAPVFQLTPFLMRSPGDARLTFTDQADLTAVEQWVRTRREEGNEDVSVMHVFIAAYVRTLALCPAMNRFVAGRFLYARDRIDIVLSSGGSGSADAGSQNVKVRFLPTDTVYDVCRKIRAQVDSIKADEEASRIERAASVLVRTPRFVLRLATGVLRFLDYHGLLSETWTDRSPFHGTAVISDEGASGLPPVSRSLNSLGCLPLSLSIGRSRTATEAGPMGEKREVRYADYTVSLDCRIADTAYIGTAFRYFRYYLANPGELELNPERVNEDTL